MRQKLAIVQALQHDPELLVLDEPSEGLDPLVQEGFFALLRGRRDAGRTVFLSSHVLPEVEQICQRVGIIREGRLVAVDDVAALKDLAHRVVEVTFPVPAAPDWFAALPGVREATPLGDGRTLRLAVRGDLGQILAIAARHHATNFATQQPSLEDVFLRFYERGDASVR